MSSESNATNVGSICDSSSFISLLRILYTSFDSRTNAPNLSHMDLTVFSHNRRTDMTNHKSLYGSRNKNKNRKTHINID